MIEFLGGLVDSSKEKAAAREGALLLSLKWPYRALKGCLAMTISDASHKNAQVYSGSKMSYLIYGTSKVRREFLSQLLERIVEKSDFSVRFFFLRCSLFCQDNFCSKLAVIILFLNQVEL